MGKVEFRPARIQNLTPEQEIVTKQVWGYMFKYFGYDLNFPVADLALPEAFVSSSINAKNTAGPAVPHAASAAAAPKKKWGWGKADASTTVSAPADASLSKRVQRVQSNKEEAYKPIAISDQHRYTYSAYYDQGNKLNKVYQFDDVAASNGNSQFSSISGDTLETNIASLNLDDKADPNLLPVASAASVASAFTKAVSLAESGEIKCSPKKNVLPLFAQYDPKDLHFAIFSTQRNNLLDNDLLRFIRARKFDVEKALTMLTKDLNWKVNECPSFEWLLEGDSVSYLSGTNPQFIRNFTLNKAWLKGRDKKGNMVFVFRAKMHLIADGVPHEEMQRYMLSIIEWCRLYMRDIKESSDQANVLFDLSGFSLKNADYTSIKFLAEIFEAHYPECLEKVFIFNAPWVFLTVWAIVKGWLDPVVASKIHFVKTVQEISEFIDIDQIPSIVGGNDHYDGDYPIPTEKDSLVKPKDARYQQLLVERDELNLQFIDRSARWIESYDPKTSSRYLEDKINIGIKLAKNFSELDPYIRRRGVPDRMKEGKLVVDIEPY